MVGLVAVMLPLTVLGMGGIGWVPLTPARTPVLAMNATVASSPVALTNTVAITVAATIPQLASLSVIYASAPLVIPLDLSRVIVSTPATATLPLLRVIYHIISRPTVAYEADLIRPDL